MAEYINRELARFEAKRYFKNLDEIQEDLDMIFCTLPAEDVAPVRHGRWFDTGAENETGNIYFCSVCNKLYNPNKKDVAMKRAKEKPAYCPNCGAKMDGGADNG